MNAYTKLPVYNSEGQASEKAPDCERVVYVLHRFIGRDDDHALQTESGGYVRARRSITASHLLKHLRGQITIGSYLLFPGEGGFASARCGCIDIDDLDIDLLNKLWSSGTSFLPPGSLVCEFSGRRGFHLWLLASEPVPAWKIQFLLRAATKNAGVSGIEIFPKQHKLTRKCPLGNLVKLPLGVHQKSGKRSFLVDPFSLENGGAKQIDPIDLDIDPISEFDIDRALAAVGARPPDQSRPECKHKKPQESGSNFPPAYIEPMLMGCAWLRHCRDDAASLSEPEWYALLSILGCCENGFKLAHEFSEPYPNYTPEETDNKLEHALDSSGPRTCCHIREHLDGEKYCSKCLCWGLAKSPISLGSVGEDDESEIGTVSVRSDGLRTIEIPSSKIKTIDSKEIKKWPS